MRYYIYSIFSLVFLISGCTPGENSPPPGSDDVEKKTEYQKYDLSSGGLPLALLTEPDESPDLTATWNAAFGRMEVFDKDDMSIFISQDTLSCKSKMEEIESGIFEVSYIVNTDSLIFYKTNLPDGHTPYWHFFASFAIDGVHYVFENNPIIECTEKQIEVMTEIVGQISSTNNLINE